MKVPFRATKDNEGGFKPKQKIYFLYQNVPKSNNNNSDPLDLY